MKSNTETPRYAVAIYIQTSSESGDRNENRFGGFFIGFLKRILTPAIDQSSLNKSNAQISVRQILVQKPNNFILIGGI